MTGETELLAVEQRHQDAANAWRTAKYRDTLAETFAHFERDHLARIAELEAAIKAMCASVRDNSKPYAEEIAAEAMGETADSEQPGPSEAMAVAVDYEITAWALANDIDGAARNDLMRRLRALAPAKPVSTKGDG